MSSSAVCIVLTVLCAVVTGEEGLVVKDLTSPYELGVKSKALGHWVKMKPEYGDQTEDLDLIVLGAYYGEGKSLRGKGLSTFLLGVRVDADGVGGSGTAYRTLCKVGTGYSFEQLSDLRSRLADVAVEWEARSPPPHLAHWHIGKTADRPHVYIPPDQSFILQLKCAEIVESTQFSAGITCRFPRVQSIRYDKPVHEAMTVADVQAVRDRPRDTTHESLLKTGGVAKKNRGPKRGRAGRGGGDDEGAVPGAGGGAGGGGGGGVREAIRAVDQSFRVSSKAVQRRGRVFDGMIFCLLGTDFAASAPWQPDQAQHPLDPLGGLGGEFLKGTVTFSRAEVKGIRLGMNFWHFRCDLTFPCTS